MKKERSAVVRTVSDELRRAARTNELLSREVAHCFALGGEKGGALDWPENTIRIENVNSPFGSDLWLENVRGERRYEALMRQVEREWKSLDPELASPRGELPTDPRARTAEGPDPRRSGLGNRPGA